MQTPMHVGQLAHTVTSVLGMQRPLVDSRDTHVHISVHIYIYT